MGLRYKIPNAPNLKRLKIPNAQNQKNCRNSLISTEVANPNWSLGRNLETLPKISTFWAAIHRKTEEIHPKLQKIADSQFEIGPHKLLFGPQAAREPRVGHPWISIFDELLSHS